MRARIGGEAGFTLVELLAAMVAGMIVIFAILGLLDTVVRVQGRTVDAIETTGRGRLAIDLVSQNLGSRICIGDRPSLVAADDDGVEFYASLAPETAGVRLTVQRRRLTFGGGSLREEIWTNSPPLSPPSLPPATSTTPTRARTIVTGVRATGTTPYLRYYANEGAPARPTRLLATPLSATDLRRAVLVDVTFTAHGRRDDVSTRYANQILSHDTTCV